jgi:UPF0755 protein
MIEEASTKPKKRRLSSLWSLLLVLVLASAWLVGDMLQFIRTPASSEPAEVVLEVPVGTSVPALSELLYGQGLVRSAGKFRWLVRFRPGELLNKIIRGEVRLHQITFPEGYTLKQMAELLEASKLVNAERFIAVATDPPFVHSLGIPATSLEGYLFPDTYRFARGLPVETVLRSFVTMFSQHFGPVQEEQARKLGFTRHQVVILASVVEKETAAAEERPLIAGVFLNRLRRRIRLQSDPTVIYGLRNFDGNLTRAHLQRDTPYNTYTRRGLPIGPICNPGAASIQAVLNPTPTPYLYFVAKKDGTHHFSTNQKRR